MLLIKDSDVVIYKFCVLFAAWEEVALVISGPLRLQVLWQQIYLWNR